MKISKLRRGLVLAAMTWTAIAFIALGIKHGSIAAPIASLFFLLARELYKDITRDP